jgi:hypothetical protein
MANTRNLTVKDHIKFLEAHGDVIRQTPVYGKAAFYKLHTPLLVFKKIKVASKSFDIYEQMLDAILDTYNKNDPLESYTKGINDSAKDRLLTSIWGGLESRMYNESGIANLEIPAGAVVFYGAVGKDGSDFGKMRASLAKLHSIVRIRDKKEVNFGVSKHIGSYKYVTAKGRGKLKTKTTDLVTNFDSNFVTCAAGIHFFADLNLALNY